MMDYLLCMMMRQRGFTLVELSIVLVILGLLVGGVLTGQSLIRAAELRSISTQYNGYVTAVQTFRDKYFALPGDMTNASAFWGAADGSTGSTAGCAADPSTDTKTCNGDGNGKIDVSANSNEWFRFWQQLANAGLIEGHFDGVAHGSTAQSATNANSPIGKISSSLWFVVNWGTQNGNLDSFNGQYDNTLEFGGVTANWDPATPVLKPEDAYNIDMKIDDGKPATGKLVIRPAVSGAPLACADTSNYATLTANYLLSSTSLACVLNFRQVF